MDKYFDIFRTDIRGMDAVIAAALSSGAGYADLFFEDTVYSSIVLRDGEVSSVSIERDYGVGIRALDGERTGYSYCETTEQRDMVSAAKIAGSIAACSSGCSGLNIPKAAATLCVGAAGSANSAVGAVSNNFYPVRKTWNEATTALLSDTLKHLERRLKDADSRILKISASISSSESRVMMYNSFGELCCDYRPMGSIGITIIFSDGRTTDSRTASRSFRKGLEMLTEDLCEEIVRELLEGMDPMLEAGRPKGGQMPVVLGAGASGILLHEAMGHAFEADFNRKGQSIFSGRMSEPICPKGINIVDDGTLYANRGACNFDDEGIPGQKTYMVTDGTLTSYLHDRISAAYYKLAPTGNGRRESFRFNPIPRMRTTYMENGSISKADIISSVKKGIYVDEFSNGQVKIGEGDFTFFVKLGYLIEDGKLTMPVKDVNIIGNGPRTLSDISLVGNDLKIDNGRWICGKDQSVAVGCGMPSVLVDNLTVGGD